jgi:uncharacterized protein (DUF58 family)
MGVSGFFGKGNLSRLSAEIDLPDEIYAGSPVSFPVRVRNDRSFMPAFLIRVSFGEESVLFPVIYPKGSATAALAMTFPKRGLTSLGSITISSVFPFHFFTRYRQIRLDAEAIVFPKLRECSLDRLVHPPSGRGGEVTSTLVGSEGELHSVREYRYGDPRKYIHWKATARTGTYKTKEFVQQLYEPPIITFEELAVENLEERLSCVSFLIMKSFRNNLPVGLRIRRTLFDPRSQGMKEARRLKLSMLRELALYESG